ncbi:poly(U)-specific endoribonuclease homolog isoform X1 [Sitophilus oryzae]|uniref:Poly(U)-specific endoribonuclease homolog isoform X1 n=1 Tax=Sitophilus oryzae TaxID=7048 RepID=A0A6J2XPG7_SITOR|nr:poly(U)-specific endoribonuclease homolog isoform X1 [Sitophilus oryzae]
MASRTTSITTFIVVVVALIFVDVFCADVTNTQQTNPWKINQNPGQKADPLPGNVKSTTPWPALGQRWTERTTSPNIRSPATTQGPKKWIQQNNLWIRNEQVASGGFPSAVTGQGSVNNNNKPNLAPNLPNFGTSTTKKPVSNSQTSNGKPVGSYAAAIADKTMSTTSVPLKTSTKGFSPVTGADNKNLLSTGSNNEDLVGNKQAEDSSSDTSGISDNELREFSEMLIRKDTNNAMKYVTLNLQGKTTSRSTNDEAPEPLLKIDSAAFQIPSVEKLRLLYNNYLLEASENEVYTPQERIEENNLLDAVLATPVMQFARSFLIQKGKIGKDPREFKDLLRLIWFNMYSRGRGRIGSSGFEHVFLAEIKNNQVSGLHNWLYFGEEERQNHANYLGYMRKIDLGENKGAIVKYHFRFNDIDKPVGSMFVGTSPELEMAVYSTCFILRPDKPCPLKMGGNRFVVRTYTYRYRSKNMIGSAFPEI